MYSIGESENTIGTIQLANLPVHTVTNTPAAAAAPGTNPPPDAIDEDWRNDWRTATAEQPDEDQPVKNKKVKKKVSKERKKARKLAEKKKRWQKYKATNAIEVEKFNRQLLERNNREQQERELVQEKAKPLNPFKEYFGTDVRKAYPYSKYTDQCTQVKRLLHIDQEVKQMQLEIEANVLHRATHTLFEPVVSVQSLRKPPQHRTGDSGGSNGSSTHPKQQQQQQQQQQGQSSFLTNSKSSKLLFAGSMDQRTHEAEWNQAWNHYNEGLSIWDAVRLGDVPRVKELLDKSRAYRERVAKYKRKGWLPLPPVERDHLNARGVDGQTPLHLVVMMRDNALHDEIFELLMAHDASICAQTIEGYTPLHYCMITELENMDMLVRMLDKADLQKERLNKISGLHGVAEQTTNEKYRERSLSQLSKMSEALLVERDTEQGNAERDGNAMKQEKSIEHKKENGTAAAATEKKNPDIQKEDGAGAGEGVVPAPKWICQSCNHSNTGGKNGSKMCGACSKVPSKWFLELEKLHRPIDMTTVYGETITSMAIKSGQEDRLKIVLEYHPNMNRLDDTGDTMLMSAVKHNRLDLIEMLLNHGADSQIKNYYAESALTYAEELCLENDDNILMMLTDEQGDLPYVKYKMKWQIPKEQWQISEKVLYEQRLHDRRSTNKGSLVKWKSKSKSKRRLGIPVVHVHTKSKQQMTMKFDTDYGWWFGQGSSSSSIFESAQKN